MASIRKEIVINAAPEDVWDALRDWGALHRRLAPGFVTETKLDGEDRIVTFFNGNTVREVLLDRDDDARRLAWSIVGGPYAHHNGSAHVFPDGDGRTRFVWVTDLLPESLSVPTAEMMERGIQVIKQTLESAARP
jgi:hypothetical protein